MLLVIASCPAICFLLLVQARSPRGIRDSESKIVASTVLSLKDDDVFDIIVGIATDPLVSELEWDRCVVALRKLDPEMDRSFWQIWKSIDDAARFSVPDDRDLCDRIIENSYSPIMIAKIVRHMKATGGISNVAADIGARWSVGLTSGVMHIRNGNDLSTLRVDHPLLRKFGSTIVDLVK